METAPAVTPAPVDYRTDPSQYRHWKLSVEGALARLTLDVAEDAGIRPGYKLKLNSYDLGVDVELADALNRIRFEHPQVRSVIVTSAKDRVFCSGANIFMLGVSSHAWKVNFCKFTNETRNGIEDTSTHSGIKFVAALNDNDPEDLQDEAHMTADDAVPSYTATIWQAFADLAAWNAWDDYVSEMGDGPVSNVHGDGMTARAAIALYWIGNRLAAGLFQEWAEGADDDESDDA